MDKTITVFMLPAGSSLKTIPAVIPNTLEVLRHYVDGCIEIATLDRYPDGSRMVMIFNDCGALGGYRVNPIATYLYQYYINAKTEIRGNAIICTADAEGELQNIDPHIGLKLMVLASEMRKGGISNEQR